MLDSPITTTTQSSPKKPATSPRKAKFLNPLENRKREILNKGDQSVILADGHNHVLLITSLENAETLQRMSDAFPPETADAALLVIPRLVTIATNLSHLIDPTSQRFARKQLKLFGISSTFSENEFAVFRMPRFLHTLEKLDEIRYKQDSIDELNKTLKTALYQLHEKGFTHNDLASRNVLVRGDYPHLVFSLADFGKVTFNADEIVHAEKCATDLLRAERIINEAKKILKDKEEFKKLQKKHTLLLYANRLLAKKGISPFQIEPKSRRRTPQEEGERALPEKESVVKRLEFKA